MLPFVTSIQDADFIGGSLLLVDKPKGWTSFDVVNKVRGLLRKKYNIKNIKVGHSGTLDPMATGLLLICTGKWTKELHHLTGLDKKYQGQITLGIETATYDAEGEVVSTIPVPVVTNDELEILLKKFNGEIDQYPPAYSAIKKDGKKLYELARAGKEVKTDARKVIVYDIQLLNFDTPILEVSVHCGSGFYVRSLAHDIGSEIGCGAHLSSLRRTSIGEYSIENAFTVEQFEGVFSDF
jgi:tRNA pseudouridine55 synthase